MNIESVLNAEESNSVISIYQSYAGDFCNF